MENIELHYICRYIHNNIISGVLSHATHKTLNRDVSPIRRYTKTCCLTSDTHLTGQIPQRILGAISTVWMSIFVSKWYSLNYTRTSPKFNEEHHHCWWSWCWTFKATTSTFAKLWRTRIWTDFFNPLPVIFCSFLWPPEIVSSPLLECRVHNNIM